MRNVWLFFFIFTLFLKAYANEETPTFIVTCASGELGSAIAKSLASENNLILTGRNTSKLRLLQEELKGKYPWDYQVAALDYCDPPSLLALERVLNSEISGLVLITPRPDFGSSLLQPESNWMQLFQTTFTGPLEVLKKVLPRLASPSKIVIIGGTTSVQFLPEYGPTCVMRRMWTTCAKALSHQLGPKGISVNVLSPGLVLTNFHVGKIADRANQNGIEYNEQMEREVAKVPLRRYASPEEVARSVKFLLSKDSNSITGVNLVIDGGATVSY